MKTLVLINQKGGVGKTSHAVHLVFYAASQGLRVVLADVDGSCNATRVLVPDLDPDLDSAHCASTLFQEGRVPAPIQVNEHISVIAGDRALSDVEAMAPESARHLRASLQRLDDRFDLCVIDTPPTLGRRLVASLIAADYAVAPMAPLGFAIQGVHDLLNTIKQVQRPNLNPRLEFLGITLNKVNSRSSAQREAIKTMRSIPGIANVLMPGQVNERTAVADALDSGFPVWRKYKGWSGKAAKDEMLNVMGLIFAEVFPDLPQHQEVNYG